jgi:organic radical activating enzyme
LQFAITNVCNAKCDFCNFAVDRFDPRQRRSVSLEEARDVIDICVKNHIGYLLFVGGEPLVHKNLREMVRYAAERGIHPMICTNGSLWTEQNMRALAADGLSSVIMSIDSHDVARHEKNRGLPDVCRKIKRANEVFAELGVQTTASVTASRLIDDYAKLPDFLRSLGFASCTFSYPLTSLASSYLSFSDSSLVSYKTGGTDRRLRANQADEGAQRLSGGQSARIAQRDAAPSAQGAGALRLPGRAQVFLSRLEPQPLPLPRLGQADVFDLRVRRNEADPGRLHQVHD